MNRSSMGTISLTGLAAGWPVSPAGPLCLVTCLIPARLDPNQLAFAQVTSSLAQVINRLYFNGFTSINHLFIFVYHFNA